MRSKTLRSAGAAGPSNGDGPLAELGSAEEDEEEGSRRDDDEVSSTWRGSLLPRGLELAHRYRIERFVARGGMGEVYVVKDQVLGERVALKTVASHDADEAGPIEQLKIEVQLARRVSHKNVCRIYDLGTHESEDGSSLVFLTMEYIEGISLGERLKQEPRLSVFEAREIAVGILEGLAAAHDAGVLHRDLKSDNVMLRADRTGRLEPILMDFGLASALNPNSSRVSGDQTLTGSLGYMAPEQLQGEPLRVTTDLYAFGVILFEMLTGRLPFVATTPAIAAIRRLQEPAPTLSSIDPTLPEEIDHVVQRCLDRDPKRRFNSALDVIHELEPGARLSSRVSSSPRPAVAGAAGSSDTRPPPTPTSDLTLAAPRAQRERRSRWFAALALVAVLIVVFVSLRYLGGSRRTASQPTEPHPAGTYSRAEPQPATPSASPPESVQPLAPQPEPTVLLPQPVPTPSEPGVPRTAAEPSPGQSPAPQSPRPAVPTAARPPSSASPLPKKPVSAPAPSALSPTQPRTAPRAPETPPKCHEDLLCPDELAPAKR